MTKVKLLRIALIVVVSCTLLSMSHFKSNPQDIWVVPPEYQNMKNPYSGVSDDEQIGEELYGMYCQTCHGSKGKGDGANAYLIETPVADFTLEPFKVQSDGSLYYKIFTGRNEMPSFEYVIPEEEDLWLVVNYVRNL